jgi:hypothetical protein
VELDSAMADAPLARFVRVALPGRDRILSLAEVEVSSAGANVAPEGNASQTSTAYGGVAERAIDGNRDGNYEAGSTTHTEREPDPWWELDLGRARRVDRLAIWNRTDNGLHTRLAEFRIELLDAERTVVWEVSVAQAPDPSAEWSPGGARQVPLAAAHADFSQEGFPARSVLEKDRRKARGGWAVAPAVTESHALVLVPERPIEVAAGAELTLTVEQRSRFADHTLGHFRLAATQDPRAAEVGDVPADIVRRVRARGKAAVEPGGRAGGESRGSSRAVGDGAADAEVTRFFLTIAPALAAERDRLAALEQELAEEKPLTTVPVLRELAAEKRRETHIQRRGNYLDQDATVSAGVPAALHPLPEPASGADRAAPDRLTLARWLIDPA